MEKHKPDFSRGTEFSNWDTVTCIAIVLMTFGTIITACVFITTVWFWVPFAVFLGSAWLLDYSLEQKK